MRIRYFLTILAVLLFVSVSVITLHTSLLQKERMEFIDQQLRTTASTLVDSELGDLRKINFKQTEAIISDELGESRLGKFFVVRNAKGEKIFESSNAKDLPVAEIPTEQRWQTIKTPTSFIRVLNLKLPKVHDRTLQVGFVVNREIVSAGYLTTSTVIILAVILTVGSLASFLLTSFLLRPIARLSAFIADSSEKLKTEPMLRKVPDEISGTSIIDSPKFHKNDEYQKLVIGYNTLIERVNKYYKNSKLWAYQMAHELKTPLTLISLEAEALKKTTQDSSRINSIQYELQKIAGTVSSFLSWAELDNSSLSKHLFANKLNLVIDSVLQRLDPHGQKFEVLEQKDLVVLSNPHHLEQLLLNLLTNADLHNSKTEKAQIKIQNSSLIIKDHGPGIPQVVLDRIGEPFNKGSSSGGSGLGLAWVNSLCHWYQWSLKIDSTSQGTTIQILF